VIIAAGNGRRGRGAENNHIIDPFEYMFKVVMSKYIKKCISRKAFDTSGCGQPFTAQCPIKTD